MTDFRALCAELVDAHDADEGMSVSKWTANLAAVLTRARTALAQPEPQGPTDEELKLVYTCAVVAAVGNTRGPFKTEDAEAAQLAGLRAVLTRWGRPIIEPVPVAERLPGPEDCLGRPWEGTDAGFCWWFYPGLDGWRLMVATIWENGAYQNWTPPGTTHWLPHYALPVPQQEAG